MISCFNHGRFIHKNIIIAHKKIAVTLERLSNSFGAGWCIGLHDYYFERHYYGYSQRDAIKKFKQDLLQWAAQQ
jgi:hypothetical protein